MIDIDDVVEFTYDNQRQLGKVCRIGLNQPFIDHFMVYGLLFWIKYDKDVKVKKKYWEQTISLGGYKK